MTKYLTTNQIAGILGVSERTVANWIDRGHLDAFRTPGGHRRVTPAAARQFLTARGMPVPREISENIRILIVEDDPVVAQTLRNYLKSDSALYDVTVKHDGVSALLHLGGHKPHVVVLDILMPGMDGLEVCRKIRENLDLQDVNVIFVTGRTDLDPETIKRDTGAFDVLWKPIRGAELRETVQRALVRPSMVR